MSLCHGRHPARQPALAITTTWQGSLPRANARWVSSSPPKVLALLDEVNAFRNSRTSGVDPSQIR